MNILIVAENGRKLENKHLFIHHSMAYWLAQSGAKTEIWGPGHELYNRDFFEVADKHDIILCMENYDTGWHPNISKLKKYKVFWSIDSHCVLSEHLKFCKDNKIDFLLNSTKAYIKHFSFVDKTLWFPNAVDHRHYKPQNVERSIPVGFCGSMIGNRKLWTNFIAKHYDLSTDYIIGDKMIERLNQYQVSLNQTISDDINYRIFENLACQTPLVTNYVPSLENLFTIDRDFLVYTNLKELIGTIGILLKDEVLAKEIATNGYNTVINNHTFMHRCKTLYDILCGV